MLEQLKKYLALVIFVAFLAASLWGFLRYRSYETQLANLRNQAAAKDKTYEELKGTYTKLAQENDSLKASSSDLQKLLDKTKQDLIAETQATLLWKGKFEYEVSHRPVTPVPGTPGGGFKPPPEQLACTKDPQLYTGSQDLGFIAVEIQTYTVDPSYQTKLLVGPGGTPLKLTLDLTRDKNKQWHTHVASSDPRVGVDIGLNSVNIEPLELRWYERIKIHLDAGASLNGSAGLLGGFGIAYQFGQYDLGPSVWGTTAGHTYGGVNFSWAPFKSR